MKNPWKEVPLSDYEAHMQLASVKQLQAMNQMMKDQFFHYVVSTLMILGIAGGNGLNHIENGDFKTVYGVDINPSYLTECGQRYPQLKGIFIPIEVDLSAQDILLPESELVVANLLIEYIGYTCFQRIIKKICPIYVSCIIQVNTNDDFVSESPYLQIFERLAEVHYEICEEGVIDAMRQIAFFCIYKTEQKMPNGKKLLRLDFIHGRKKND